MTVKMAFIRGLAFGFLGGWGLAFIMVVSIRTLM